MKKINKFDYHKDKVDELQNLETIKNEIGKINLDTCSIQYVLSLLYSMNIPRSLDQEIAKKLVLSAKPIINNAISEAKYNVECSSNHLKRTG